MGSDEQERYDELKKEKRALKEEVAALHGHVSKLTWEVEEMKRQMPTQRQLGRVEEGQKLLVETIENGILERLPKRLSALENQVNAVEERLEAELS